MSSMAQAKEKLYTHTPQLCEIAIQWICKIYSTAYSEIYNPLG